MAKPVFKKIIFSVIYSLDLIWLIYYIYSSITECFHIPETLQDSEDMKIILVYETFVDYRKLGRFLNKRCVPNSLLST